MIADSVTESAAEQGAQTFIGVDIGGSKIRAGLIAGSRPMSLVECAIGGNPSPEIVASLVWAACDQLLVQVGIDYSCVGGVGIAIPGPIRRTDGFSKVSPNLGWTEVPFGEILRDGAPLDSPMVFDHDVYAAAHGEALFGAATGMQEFIYVMVGTGVGGALVIDGNLHPGSHESAGEIGHIRLVDGGRPCGCGASGCLEQYASVPALIRAAYKSGFRGIDGAPSGEEIAAAASAGDRVATHAIREVARAAARGISATITLLDVRNVIVGGGLSEAGETYLRPLREEVTDLVMPTHKKHLRILAGDLGPDAGWMGMAAIAAQTIGDLRNPQNAFCRGK